MGQPKSLKVFGTDYSLKSIKGMRENGVAGMCENGAHAISIDADLKGDAYWQTVLHELFHAAFYQTSIVQAITPDVEEIIVDILAKVTVANCTVKFRDKRTK